MGHRAPLGCSATVAIHRPGLSDRSHGCSQASPSGLQFGHLADLAPEVQHPGGEDGDTVFDRHRTGVLEQVLAPRVPKLSSGVSDPNRAGTTSIATLSTSGAARIWLPTSPE
jgi:hypothetical protein